MSAKKKKAAPRKVVRRAKPAKALTTFVADAEHLSGMHYNGALHAFAWLTSLWALLVIFWGGMVSSTGSGMAVPDWPTSFGVWNPKMEGGVFYEHGHRMVAGLLGALILLLSLWLAAIEKRARVRWVAWTALILVFVQALLGGLTVLIGTWRETLTTHPAVSALHATLAQVVFALLVAIAVLTSKGWVSHLQEAEDQERPGRMARWFLGLLMLQIILGAVMRQNHAGLIIADFPLNNGRLIPEFVSWLVGVNFAHRVGAFILLSLGLTLAFKVLALQKSSWYRRPAWGLLLALLIQFSLGAFTVWTARLPWVASAHVLGGSATLAFGLLLALRLNRVQPTLV